MWEQARYLASVGHTVTFVAASYSGASESETVEGMHLVRLGGVHSLWLRTFIYYMRYCRGRHDVVVTEGFGGSRIPRMAPLYVREPIITEWHQIHRDLFAAQYPRLLRGPLNLLERITAWVHRNTLVRAGTREWALAFPSIGFKTENIFTIPVSIRDDWLAQSNPPQPRDPTIVWIGKLRRYKCPHHAMLAMTEVLKHVPEARLVVAGRRDDVAYERTLRRLVCELRIERNVEFRLNVTEQEKRELLCGSRALVLPSAVEGFGIVVLEANACGLPVVASSGVPVGAVRDRANGLRYPFGQIDALSKCLIEILTDDNLYEQLSANGRSFAHQFGWSQVGRQYEVVVRHLAGLVRPDSEVVSDAR